MGVLIEDITETALSLPIADRAVLADRLMESLDEREDAVAVREAWITEIRRRVAEVKSGKAVLIDGEVGLAQVRASIRK
ncbi:MAG: addiction module protein [Pyrinomonadaceae bacterium]|nr:addiction module protein [Acidobacteriota bacterium]MBK7932547.1 addiction module protein [Acidobacteriota bacterium]MBP7377931.1 addiction module protein [Pyrinomonadaceae bacterium]